MTDIDTLFQNARLPDGRTVDIAVKNGQISAIAAGLRVAARESTDLKRRLVLPGLVDAHCHVGLASEGGVPIDVAREQAMTDRDTGALLLRDAGVPHTYYEFDDDPLSAGGFGPSDATIKVRPKAARTTLIRPRTHFIPEMLKSVENI